MTHPALTFDYVSGGLPFAPITAAYGANLFVAMQKGTSSTYITSNDGFTWSKRTLPVPFDTTKCWSPLFWNGNQFVIATGSMVLTSADGLAWSVETIPALLANNYAQVHFGWNGSSYAILCGTLDPTGSYIASAHAYASADGVTWVDCGLLAYSSGIGPLTWTGSLYVALPYEGRDGTYFTSDDGTAWTKRSCYSIYAQSPTPTSFVSLTTWSGNAVALFVPASGSQCVVVSADGLSWTANDVPLNNVPLLCAGAGYLVGCMDADANFMYSFDSGAASWTSGALPVSSNPLDKVMGGVLVCSDDLYLFLNPSEDYFATNNPAPFYGFWQGDVGCLETA